MRELPVPVEDNIWKGANEGLIAVSLLSTLIANTVDLGEISSMGSLSFLLVFTLANLAALILRDKIKISWIFPLFATILSFAAFVVLFRNTLEASRLAAILFISF